MINGTEPTTEPTEPTEQGSQEYFDFKDLQTGKTLKLPKNVDGINLQEVIGHTISGSRNITKKELTSKYSTIEQALQEKEATIEQLQAKFQEIEESQLSDQQRIQKQFERELEKTRNAAKEFETMAQRNFRIFEEEKIKNDILSVMSKYQINNPNQAFHLIKQELNAKLIEQDGNYTTRLYLDDEEINPQDAVGKWLARPENMHHLKNNLKPGGGTSINAGAIDSDGKKVFKRSQLNDPAIRKQYSEMIRAKQEVKIIEG